MERTMATRTSVANGLWSSTDTWDTGVPADTDAVVIASGHTVVFDVDQSAFGTGIGDLTINGTLNVSTAVSTNMRITAAKAIRGTGTFNIGTAGAGAIPFAVKFTLTGGAGWGFTGNDTTGLTVNIYGTEPANKWVQFSGNEAIGQTELSVGTDVTGEASYWKAGDEVMATSYKGSAETETLTIASVAASAITMTGALTSAKATGNYLVLLSRNVTITFVATTNGFGAFKDGKLHIGSGRIIAANNYCINGCTNPVMSGGVVQPTAIGSQTACYASSLQLTGGTIVGQGRGIYGSNYATMSGGLIAGTNEPTNAASGFTLSGGIIYGYKDNQGAIYNGSHYARLLGGTIVSNANGYLINISNFVYINGTTFHNTATLISSDSYGTVIKGLTITGTAGTVFYRTPSATLYGIDLSGFTTEMNGYVGYTYPNGIVECLDYNGVSGAYKGWTRGGLAVSQTSVMPSGYSLAYLITPASTSAQPAFINQYFIVPAGESRSIEVQLRKSASMVYLPKVYLSYEVGAPMEGETPLDSFTMTDSTDTWETDTFTIDNTSGASDLKYKLVFVANAASGNVYAAYAITDTTPGGSGGGAVSIQPIQGSVRL